MSPPAAMAALWCGAVVLGVGVLVLGVGADTTEYTPPVLNNSYVSEAVANARGLGPLYDVTTSFLRAVRNPDPLPPGVFQVRNGTFTFTEDVDVMALVKYYTGVVAVAATGAVLLVFLLFGPLVWCCIRCCKCQGSSAKDEVQMDDDPEPHKGGRRHGGGGKPTVLPVVLAVITGLLICFSVVNLVTNAYVDDGIYKLGGRVTDVISDVALFVRNADKEVDTFLGDNYDQLTGTLEGVLTKFKTDTVNKMTEISEAVPTEEFRKESVALKTLSDDLKEAQTEATSAVQASNSITQDIQSVRRRLVTKCGNNCPAEVQEILKSLDVAPIPALPDLSDSIASLSNVVNADFESPLRAIEKQLDDLANQVDDKATEVQKTIVDAFATTGKNLRETAHRLTDAVNNATSSLDDASGSVRDIDNKYIKPYDQYRFYAFLVIGLLLLLVAVSTTAGLLWGWCSAGRAPYSRSYTLGAIALFTLVLLPVVTAFFAVGMAGDIACQALREPRGNQVLGLFDDWLQSSTSSASSNIMLHNISYYIEACHNDRPMYEVLDLNTTIDIDKILEYADRFSFDDYIKNLDAAEQLLDNVVLVPEELRTMIKTLETSDVAKFDFTGFKSQIASGEATIAVLTPSVWADQLEAVASSIPGGVAAEATQLRAFETRVEELKSSAANLGKLAAKLEVEAQQGHASFAEGVQALLDIADEATTSIKGHATDVDALAVSTAATFAEEMKGYLRYAVNHIKEEALRCGPLSRSYNATVVATCDEILNPMNGFWATGGASIILFAFIAVLIMILNW